MAWAAIGAATIGVVGSALLAPDDEGQATGMADPFASQRPQYQTQLSALMNGQFSPTDPSYQWRFDQGMETVNRTMASQGMLASGRQLSALAEYGQGMASTEYANQFARLSRLAGADIGSPATAAQIQYGQDQERQRAATAAGGTIGNAAGAAINSWTNGGSSPTDMTGFQSSSYDPWSGYDWSGGGTAPAYYDPLPASSASFGSGWMV